MVDNGGYSAEDGSSVGIKSDLGKVFTCGPERKLSDLYTRVGQDVSIAACLRRRFACQKGLHSASFLDVVYFVNFEFCSVILNLKYVATFFNRQFLKLDDDFEGKSVEDMLRQQIEKKEFYDDGGKGKKPPSGCGGGNSGDGSASMITLATKLEVISRFKKKGFKLTGLKLFEYPKELAEDVHPVQQSPALQKSSTASHQPSCL
ncbi:hypothetical protein SO802_026403 [Lithocarpus litseifolius]|uniref:Uncharacterized protein n=1 Tax=Lithocarpus litseifolius TaxID=425828 RepID=A0AAW2C0F0_9ROSI